MPFLSLRNNEFHPLTLSMYVEDILFGTMSLRTRWKKSLTNYPISPHIWIEPTLYPDRAVIEAIQSLRVNETLRKDNIILAAHLDDYGQSQMIKEQSLSLLDKLDIVTYDDSYTIIQSLQYIIEHNKDQIIRDWEDEEKTNWSCPPQFNNTFIAPGVFLPQVVIDDRQGPVIIHSDVTILAGARIMGPVVLLPGSVVKMGAELYPGCTIGRHATVSGETKNSIIHEYSAKGHTGYLGDSILGRWNNFGAGTTVSNVTNTFSKIRFDNWDTGIQVSYDTIKRGLVTGDFVKLGIMSKVYSGTSIGSFTSITSGSAIQGNIPELTWWTEKQKTRYQSDQLRTHCRRQMELYKQSWTDDWENSLSRVLAMNKIKLNSPST